MPKGLPRPAGYATPPPPPLADALRTLRVALTDLLPNVVVRLALDRDVPPSSTEAGMAELRAMFRATLARLAVDLEVRHAERVPAAGGLLLFWNQESHLDHLVLPAALPRPFVMLYNNEVARTPLYGPHLARSGHLHIDRTDEAQWRASIARAAAHVREGGCVLVSPEGTRSWDGKLLPMKRGALMLAAQAESPLVCVTVVGGHRRLPRGSAFVRRGPVRVLFSEPIATAGKSEAQIQELTIATFEQCKREAAL